MARVVALYVVVAGLWIVASDRLLAAFARDAPTFARWSTYKGWIFVAFTAALLAAVLSAEAVWRERSLRALRATEAALRANERDLVEAQRLADIGSWVWDTRAGRHVWSDAVFRIYGRDPALGPAGVPELSAYFTPESWTRLAAAVERGARDGVPYACDAEVVRPGGERRWITARGEPLVDAQGRQHGLRGTVQDVTERRQAELALRASEHDYRLLFRENPHPMWIYDVGDLRLLEVNEAAVAHYGYSRDEFRAMTIVDLRPREETPRLLAHLKAPAPPADSSGPWRHRRRDGSVIEVEVRSHALDWQGHHARLVLAHDVTERERAKRTLEVLNTELDRRVHERTRQLETANAELDAFTRSVSHDLRAPLRAIAGYVRMVDEDHGATLAPEARRMLDVVSCQASAMQVLIDDLLRFSRLDQQAVRAETVDMGALARGIADELERSMQERDVSIQIGDLPAAHGDRALLRQVLVNLLDNAVKYTRTRERAEIVVSGRREPGEAVFAVADNGVGFDMKDASRLGVAFQRLHAADRFEGTGLGLALVRRLVERHGGRLWAEARPDQGATFFFALPLTLPRTRGPEWTRSPPPPCAP